MINAPLLQSETCWILSHLWPQGISENKLWTCDSLLLSSLLIIVGDRDFARPDGSGEAGREFVIACGCPHSAEPPVRIIHPRDEVTLTAVSLECVVLMCELSREDALVRWYKDGLEVEESEALVLESDGPCRRLVLPAAQPEDGGEFVCDAGDDSAFFTVTVTGGKFLGHTGELEKQEAEGQTPKPLTSCILGLPSGPTQPLPSPASLFSATREPQIRSEQ